MEPTEVEERPEIDAFAQQMERVMRAHDANKGDSWKGMSAHELRSLLDLKFYGTDSHSFGDSPNDYIDLANFCMMVWATKFPKKATPEE